MYCAVHTQLDIFLSHGAVVYMLNVWTVSHVL